MVNHEKPHRGCGRAWAASDSRQEVLDLVDDLMGVDPRQVVFSRQLNEARVRDPLGNAAALNDAGVQVAAPVQHQRRPADDREDA